MAPEGHDPNYISALLWKEGGRTLHWSGNAPKITYSFYEPGQRPMDLGAYSGARAPTAAQKAGLAEALGRWEEVANIDFVATSGDRAHVRIAYGDLPSRWLAITHVEFSGRGSLLRAEIWLNDRYAYMGDVRPGSYAFFVALHEIGHAIGLDHSFDGAAKLGAAYDNASYTVMSYTDHPGVGNGPSGLRLAPSTPMLYDIAAVQSLYGANKAHASGNDTYRFADGFAEVRTIWDAGGNDTIDASDQVLPVVIDLREGAASSIGRRGKGTDWNRPASGNVRIAFGTVIENAVGGSGNDVLIGNDVANRLEGGGGNDVLYGGGGSDTFVFEGSFGTDRIRDAEPGEHLVFRGIAVAELHFDRSGNDLVIGHRGNKVIVENFFGSVKSLAINDQPFGTGGLLTSSGGGATPSGVDRSGTASGGQRPADDTRPGASVDALHLIGSAGRDKLVGGAGDDELDGGDGDDKIIGRGGNDTLLGGAGRDELIGNDGDDILIGGPGDDTIIGGRGEDTAVFHGAFADFSIIGRKGKYTVTDLNPGDGDLGRDRVKGVEFLRFDDVLLDLRGSVPVAYRLAGALAGDADAIVANDGYAADHAGSLHAHPVPGSAVMSQALEDILEPAFVVTS
jgi:serralysin